MSESAIHNSTASGAATNRTGSQSAIHLSPNQKAFAAFSAQSRRHDLVPSF